MFSELNFCLSQVVPKVLYNLYFDFAKAFDSVPHNRLISKLQSSGISGNLLEWIRNFLVGRNSRRQKIVLNNNESEWSEVVSGVATTGLCSRPISVQYLCK